MNWVDLVIIVLFAIYCLEGVWRGFLEQILDLIGFLLTVLVAVWLYKPFSGWVVANIGIKEPVAGPVAFLLIWFILQGLISFLFHMFLPLLPATWRTARWNRWLGVVPAVIKAFVIVAVVITLTVLLPVPEQLKNQISASQLGSQFLARSSTIESSLNRIFGRDIKQSLTFLTVEPQTEEIIPPNSTVDLEFTTDKVTVDKTSEQQMLTLVNQERVKAGFGPLVWDEALAAVARAHAKNMFKLGYFAHKDPDGRSPFDRITNAGISFKAAGENLAYASTVELAHAGLMRSEGHRANILDKDFGRAGIGVIDAGAYGKMFTQIFKD